MIQAVLKSRFSRQTLVVYLGQLGMAVLGFALNLLLIRQMSPSDFGRYSLYLSASLLLAGLMPLGWIETYSRFGAVTLDRSNEVAAFFLRKILKGGLWIGVIAIVFAPWITESIYQRGDFYLTFLGSVVTAGALSIWNWRQVTLQNQQKFHQGALTQVLYTLLRVATVAGVGWLQGFELSAIVVASIVLPMGAAVLSLRQGGVQSQGVQNQASFEPSGLESIRQHRKWIVVSTLCNVLIGNIDLSILAYFHPNETLAQYGVAGRMALPLQMATTALSTVLLPRFASTADLPLVRSQLKRLLGWLIPIALLLAVLTYWLAPLLAWMAGDAYADTTPLIRIFLGSTLVILVCNPPGTLLTAWGFAKWSAVLNGVQLVLDIVLDLIWIPKYGAMGAAWASFCIFCLGLIATYWQLYRVLNGKVPIAHQAIVAQKQ